MKKDSFLVSILPYVRIVECFLCAGGAFQLVDRKLDTGVFMPIVVMVVSFAAFFKLLLYYDRADYYIPVEILQGVLLGYGASWDIEKMINKKTDSKLGLIVVLGFVALFIVIKLLVYLNTYVEIKTRDPLGLIGQVITIALTYVAMGALCALVKYNPIVTTILTVIAVILIRMRKGEKANERFEQSFGKHDEGPRHYEEPRTESESAYFGDCHDLESLKRTYHQLVKVFHSDSGNVEGNSTFLKIKEEYERELTKYK